MPHRITDECLACGICVDGCPNNAIFEGEVIYYIDPEKCDDCGTCIEVCPSRGTIIEE